MMKRANLQEVTKNLVKKLKKIKAVKAVYLFGSYAIGKPRSFSDIDICVIAQRISKSEKAKIASLGSRKVQVSFFDDLPIYIKFEVIKGKQLFVRDEEFLHKLTFRTLKEYYDFWPLLKRFERFYRVKV